MLLFSLRTVRALASIRARRSARASIGWKALLACAAPPPVHEDDGGVGRVRAHRAGAPIILLGARSSGRGVGRRDQAVFCLHHRAGGVTHGLSEGGHGTASARRVASPPRRSTRWSEAEKAAASSSIERGSTTETRGAFAARAVGDARRRHRWSSTSRGRRSHPASSVPIRASSGSGKSTLVCHRRIVAVGRRSGRDAEAT